MLNSSLTPRKVITSQRISFALDRSQHASKQAVCAAGCCRSSRSGAKGLRTPGTSQSVALNFRTVSSSYAGHGISYTIKASPVPAFLRRRSSFELRASAAEPKPEEPKPEEAMDNAKKLLDKIVSEMQQELMAQVQATGAKTDAEAAELYANALAQVVEKHKEELDGAFLAAISAFIKAAEAQKNEELVSLLTAIKEEAIACVTKALPPELQLVEEVAKLLTIEERKEALAVSFDGGDEARGIPSTQPMEVAMAAGEIIDDIERAAEVVDWRFLMRMCAVREYVRQSDDEPAGDADNDEDKPRRVTPKGGVGPTMSLAEAGRTTVPWDQGMELEYALVNNLMSVGDAAKRKGLIKFSFEQSQKAEKDESARKKREEFEKKEKKKRNALIKPQGIIGEAVQAVADSAPVIDNSGRMQASGVRPGRLMDTLSNAQRDTALKLDITAGKPMATLGRLREIRADVLQVIEDMS